VESDPIGLDGGTNTYGYVEANPIADIDPEGKHGRYSRDCGRCKLIYDNDQWKGAHTHWVCPGQPQGCVRKNGELCDNSAPPPRDVKDCLEKWQRIPVVKKEMCGDTCKETVGVVVVGGLIIDGACLAGPPGAAGGAILGTALTASQ
jgi:hypothetical protein